MHCNLAQMLEAWTRPVLLALPKLKSDTKTKFTMSKRGAPTAQGAPTAVAIRLTEPPLEKKQRIAHQSLEVDIWISDKHSKQLSTEKMDEWQEKVASAMLACKKTIAHASAQLDPKKN
jgi:hypothetical protein